AGGCPGHRRGGSFRVSPASRQDRVHRRRTVFGLRRLRGGHAGHLANRNETERFAIVGPDLARRRSRLWIAFDGWRRDRRPLAGCHSRGRRDVMSTSSDSRLLDRRGFLRLGAGVLATASAAFQWGCNLTTRACKVVPPNPFVAAGKPLLVVVEGEDLGAMLRAGIEALGGLDPLTKLGHEVMFRGNYVMSQPYPVTTAPEFVLAVAGELKRAGVSKTSLFDSSGTRLGAAIQPERMLRRLGVLDKLTQGGLADRKAGGCLPSSARGAHRRQPAGCQAPSVGELHLRSQDAFRLSCHG